MLVRCALRIGDTVYLTTSCGPARDAVVRDETQNYRPRTFYGSEEQFHMLSERDIRFRVRFDRAVAAACQHQKSWIMDAGQGSEVAFVGGINLNPLSLVNPGHDGSHSHHDAYAELAGPSGTDVHHNFVQRWTKPVTGARRTAFGRSVISPFSAIR